MIAWVGGILTLMLAAAKIWEERLGPDRDRLRRRPLTWGLVLTPLAIALAIGVVFMLAPFVFVALLS